MKPLLGLLFVLCAGVSSAAPTRSVTAAPPNLAPRTPAAPGVPAPDPPFEETTQVTSVEVPVNVVDREGQPVRGLQASRSFRQ